MHTPTNNPQPQKLWMQQGLLSAAAPHPCGWCSAAHFSRPPCTVWSLVCIVPVHRASALQAQHMVEGPAAGCPQPTVKDAVYLLPHQPGRAGGCGGSLDRQRDAQRERLKMGSEQTKQKVIKPLQMQPTYRRRLQRCSALTMHTSAQTAPTTSTDYCVRPCPVSYTTYPSLLCLRLPVYA